MCFLLFFSLSLYVLRQAPRFHTPVCLYHLVLIRVILGFAGFNKKICSFVGGCSHVTYFTARILLMILTCIKISLGSTCFSQLLTRLGFRKSISVQYMYPPSPHILCEFQKKHEWLSCA